MKAGASQSGTEEHQTLLVSPILEDGYSKQYQGRRTASAACLVNAAHSVDRDFFNERVSFNENFYF